MANLQPDFPPTERPNLAHQLTGYWASDFWYYKDCPTVPESERSKVANWSRTKLAKPIVFACQLANLNDELKFACSQKLLNKEWLASTLWTRVATIHYLADWLDASDPPLQSLIDQTLEEAANSFQNYLISKGRFSRYKSPPRFGKDQQPRQYEVQSPHITTFRAIYKVLDRFYNPQYELDQEVWDVRRMGYKTDPTKSSHTVSFVNITQPWLLAAAKKFIEYSLVNCSVGESQGRAAVLRDFSCFLHNHHPTLQPEDLSRPVVSEFLNQLSKTGLKGSTRCRQVSVLRTFLELCGLEGWAIIPDKQYIYRTDFPDIEKPLPRYIPEEVLFQLNENLEELPEQIMRMTLVIQEGGLRVGELCILAFDCLIQDAERDYFLRYYQSKMKKDHTIPIEKELAGVIQEQQEFVRQQWGDTCPYLFPNDKGKPFKQKVFSDALNRLAVEKNIRTAAGVLWRFQAHQFRHTVGTKMINNGVPQHMVQRFLGHASPEMTARYAFIFDQTMKNEFVKFKQKTVNVHGQIVAPESLVSKLASGSDPNLVEEQWLKQNVRAQALSNGGCWLPAIQPRCPYGANRCLTGPDGEGCQHFHTDTRFLAQHQEHLRQTSRIVQWAEENPDSRRAQEILEENLPVKQNLERIIDGLLSSEEHSNESSA